jgi:hypothetical protein
MEFTHTEKVLQEYGERVMMSYQNQLDSNGKNASGSLRNTISVVVEKNEGSYEVALNLNEYWKWLEGGRPPTQNNGDGSLRRAILNWIKVKHIMPTPFNGKLPTESQLAYLISRKIHTLGYEGKPMLEDALTENDEFLMNLELALLEDVAVDVEKVLVLFK